MVQGGGEKSPSGSGNTAALDLLGQDTGSSGGLGGPMAYFRNLCEGDVI